MINFVNRLTSFAISYMQFLNHSVGVFLEESWHTKTCDKSTLKIGTEINIDGALSCMEIYSILFLLPTVKNRQQQWVRTQNRIMQQHSHRSFSSLWKIFADKIGFAISSMNTSRHNNTSIWYHWQTPPSGNISHTKRADTFKEEFASCTMSFRF